MKSVHISNKDSHQSRLLFLSYAKEVTTIFSKTTTIFSQNAYAFCNDDRAFIFGEKGQVEVVHVDVRTSARAEASFLMTEKFSSLRCQS